jgi:hypothetical protein
MKSVRNTIVSFGMTLQAKPVIIEKNFPRMRIMTTGTFYIAVKHFALQE